MVATLAVRMDELGRGVYQPVPIHERGGGIWCIQDKVEYAARFGAHFGPACVSLGSPQETRHLARGLERTPTRCRSRRAV